MKKFKNNPTMLLCLRAFAQLDCLSNICGCFFMKEITLSQGKVAIVDDEDYEWLNKWKWNVVKRPHTYYAVRHDYSLGKHNPIHIAMHRLILGITDKKLLADHIDRNGLNNQRNNLRVATKHQNSMNCSKKQKNGLSKFLGVSVITQKLKSGTKKIWVASIRVKYKYKYLGWFPFTNEGEIEAAKAYDEGAKKYFKEFANLNFKNK